ncbi:MAG: Amine acid ABC transporter, permease protein, 3-TM region, His/Glu/Gln/Arg/opine family [Candidatus Daviesbacteria bacterium GW2011_GWC2_40_12]|uniref:Amine acid ABC transporter, permease protein, 3-TM region, His/Glu/Gln/Arg/opine family n=1 Tax=Candidatus Daviesbacteria bacterium GW2011_GWC2_40_12 TaxID=1618431 RepID=A0A0G0QMQ2_9BACT|nr:MAG: Amine acid ABC transporter, permease protein, 3-TM region, His/Glu/Gln/Arg/opine family [Candidatus Daviesbacteria bacterium GW2011_GWC2_40_12]
MQMYKVEKRLIKFWIVTSLIACLTITIQAQPSKKILRYGADASSGAPYVFQNPKNINQLIGFEVDIINSSLMPR